ncbi:MAG: type I restriction endonuclease subunit R [Cyanobacteriota bacterium]|nr:type I restriction endonuclease subunit R [Cyanobacteriota bacterium]
MSTTAITDAITTLAEAERRFRLHRTEEEDFFSEWRADLPTLTDTERTRMKELRRRYLYQRAESHLLEGTVMLLLASPLLAIAGFFDPPFKVRAEESVQIILEDEEEVLQGRIDALVIQNQLWVIILESKKTALSVWSALPQTLAYLMANPQPERPSFGVMTNGDDILFVKLIQTDNRQYGVSRVFSPFSSEQELHSALQVLKAIGRLTY